jgi:inward rectifier potassium channel
MATSMSDKPRDPSASAPALGEQNKQKNSSPAVIPAAGAPAAGTLVAGTPIARIGHRRWHWSDSYHLILTLSWPRFFVLIGGFYLLINLIFAAAFYAVPGAVANARPGSFADVFFFSIETLATVGYGYMNPGSIYGHVIASIEILIGMLSIAIVTGLLFARFSRPTARVMFSDVIVITTFNGVRMLMLRAANERNNLILEATVRATIVKKEITQEGETFYRVYDLNLERERTSAFVLSWTVMHKIDESSPLFGATQAELIAAEARVNIAISGLDETLNDIVHARRNYEPEQLKFGYRFVDILFEQSNSVWAVDFSKFHDVKPDSLNA